MNDDNPVSREVVIEWLASAYFEQGKRIGDLEERYGKDSKQVVERRTRRYQVLALAQTSPFGDVSSEVKDQGIQIMMDYIRKEDKEELRFRAKKRMGIS